MTQELVLTEKNSIIPVRAILHTNGKGLYTKTAASVEILELELASIAEDDGEYHGELCVYFDGTTWDVEKNNVIYTDPLFLTETQAMLEKLGIASTGVDYSERGWQGIVHVSFDVGQQTIETFLKVANRR